MGLQGQRCSASLLAGPWVLGHGRLLPGPVERHGLFQSDLLLVLNMLSSREQSVFQRGNHSWVVDGASSTCPHFPRFLCSAGVSAGLRSLLLEPTQPPVPSTPGACSCLPLPMCA